MFSHFLTPIHTQRLTLRTFAPSDLEDALAIFFSEQISATYMLPDFPDRESAVKLFDRLLSLSRSSEHLVLAIDRAGTLIGFLNNVQIEGKTIEVGYAIHPDHWNRGYATEALRAVIDTLLRTGFSAVRAGFFEGNSASGRVMEKSGMHPIDFTDTVEYRGISHRCVYYEICAEQC